MWGKQAYGCRAVWQNATVDGFTWGAWEDRQTNLIEDGNTAVLQVANCGIVLNYI